MTVVRINCPWLLRYIAAAVILQRQRGSKDSRQNPWRQGRRLTDFVKVGAAYTFASSFCPRIRACRFFEYVEQGQVVCSLSKFLTRAHHMHNGRFYTTIAQSTRTRSLNSCSSCTCGLCWGTSDLLADLTCLLLHCPRRYFDHDLIGAKNTLAELESVLKSDFFLFQVRANHRAARLPTDTSC